MLRIFCYIRLLKRWWRRSKEGYAERKLEPFLKQGVRKAQALPIARLLNVTW